MDNVNATTTAQSAVQSNEVQNNEVQNNEVQNNEVQNNEAQSNEGIQNEEVKENENVSSSDEGKDKEVQQESNNEVDLNQESVGKESGIDDVVSKLGQSKLEEIYNSYEEIENILSDNEALEQLSKEEIINLTRQKAELEKFISEIEPLLEQQRQKVYEETIGKYGEPVQQVVEDLFGNDLNVDELALLDEFISRIKDSLVSNSTSTQSSNQQQQEVNIGQKIAGRDNTQVDGGQSLNEMLLSDDPSVREAAIKKMDELMDMYIKQNK